MNITRLLALEKRRGAPPLTGFQRGMLDRIRALMAANPDIPAVVAIDLILDEEF